MKATSLGKVLVPLYIFVLILAVTVRCTTYLKSDCLKSERNFLCSSLRILKLISQANFARKRLAKELSELRKSTLALKAIKRVKTEPSVDLDTAISLSEQFLSVSMLEKINLKVNSFFASKRDYRKYAEIVSRNYNTTFKAVQEFENAENEMLNNGDYDFYFFCVGSHTNRELGYIFEITFSDLLIREIKERLHFVFGNGVDRLKRFRFLLRLCPEIKYSKELWDTIRNGDTLKELQDYINDPKKICSFEAAYEYFAVLKDVCSITFAGRNTLFTNSKWFDQNKFLFADLKKLT